MLLTEPFFQGFTKKPISDAHQSTEVLLALSLDSRAEVEAVMAKAIAAGATTPNAPVDHGFMYQHGFADHFGPWVSPINAFLLIGLDLALRDWLHMRLKAWQMLSLIGASGLLTYALNPSAQHIVIASAAAFTLAALVDWQAFSRLSGSWLRRSLGSNVAGAVVDTAVFSALAFVLLSPSPKPLEVVAQIAGLQLLAKVCGGSLWAWLLARTVQREADAF